MFSSLIDGGPDDCIFGGQSQIGLLAAQPRQGIYGRIADRMSQALLALNLELHALLLRFFHLKTGLYEIWNTGILLRGITWRLHGDRRTYTIAEIHLISIRRLRRQMSQPGCAEGGRSVAYRPCSPDFISLHSAASCSIELSGFSLMTDAFSKVCFTCASGRYNWRSLISRLKAHTPVSLTKYHFLT